MTDRAEPTTAPPLLDPTTLPVPVPTAATNPSVANPTGEGQTRELTYPETVRRRGWWRGLVAVLGVVVGMVAGQLIFGIGAYALVQAVPALDGGLAIGPVTLLGINLSLVALIPVSLLLSKLLYGSASDLWSVLGRIRWGTMARAATIVIPAWLVFQGVGLLAGITMPTQPAVWALLLVSVLTTPLQAAAEEITFRGLLFKAGTSWGRGGVGVLIGIALSSVLFAIAHFVSNPWMLAYFFMFGASLAVIAWRTGGLEVSILIHAVHNVLSFVIGVLAVGNIDALATRNDVNPGPFMLIYGMVLVIAAAVTWVISVKRPLVRTVIPGWSAR